MKKSCDFVLLIAVILLVTIGIIMIYSSSNIWALSKYGDALKFVKSQVVFIIIGFGIVHIVSKIDYFKYLNKANILLIVCFLLLILVAIPGIGTVRNGSRSWFGLGSFGIQPSEFAKLGLIVFTAKYLSINDKAMSSFKKGILPIFLIALSLFALIMLQPDFGTGMILIITFVGMLFISKTRLKFFGNLVIIGILGIIGLIVSAPYRLERILSFLNPWKDPLGSGFQIIQSLYAIGPGGLLGLGFLNSIQKHFYLPEPQTDFIFSIICEEFGFLGAIVIVVLFTTILYRGFKIALGASDLFSKFLAFGIVFQIVIQAILNLSVVIGLIPVTGVTLPFLSYGGSSLLITMVEIGILLNISRYRLRD